MDLSKSGQASEITGDFPEAPEATLEHLLAASCYLVEVDLARGSLEDIAYRLTVRLAQERKASKDQYDLLSTEVRRYRERWQRERLIANDLADENAELAEKLELAEAESDWNTDALVTAQERLDNALAMVDELSAQVNWDLLLNGDNDV